MNQYKDKYGYFYVALSKNNKKVKFKTHRLVALAFIPNFDNLPQINHKDENKGNNKAENLEWCTCEYNLKYGTRMKKLYKRVIAIDKYGETKIFKSIKDASKILNIDSSSITKCCKGKRKKAKNIVWRYYEER